MLPGWNGSEPEHWQSRWEQVHAQRNITRVAQHDWQHPLRGDWMAQLEEAVLGCEPPVVLIAHSLGCHLVAAWAAHTRHAAKVGAALLVAPADVQRDDLAPALYSWRPPVLRELPFASLVLASSDDPYASVQASGTMAQAWGAGLMVLGALGHINAASDLGDWDQGWQILEGLLADVSPARRGREQDVDMTP